MKKHNARALTIAFISDTFLFKNIDAEKIASLTDGLEISVRNYETGDLIYTHSEFDRSIGFVFDGECVVEKSRGEILPPIPLNKLKRFDSFGVLTIFSGASKYPTDVRARKASTVVFISEKDIRNLIQREPQTALNIIEFMANKIDFLNDKISTFSADNVEQKLSKFLLLEHRKYNSMTFDFNCKRTSESLNAGRASMYRAIDSLSGKGIIKLENKKIFISNLEGLERISK